MGTERAAAGQNHQYGKNKNEKSRYETFEDDFKKAIFGVLYLLL